MDLRWITGGAAVAIIALGLTTANSKASATTVLTGSAGTIIQSTAPSARTALGGNVVAVVPGVSIVSDDHIPQVLDRHHSYRAAFLIWVAPNARRATMKAHADNGSIRHCSASRLKPGVDAYVTCTVKPDAKDWASTTMTIDVVVHTANLGQYMLSYGHQVTGWPGRSRAS